MMAVAIGSGRFERISGLEFRVFGGFFNDWKDLKHTWMVVRIVSIDGSLEDLKL